MRIIQIVPGIAEKASGTSYSVPSMCQALSDNDQEIELHMNYGDKPVQHDYKCYTYGSWKISYRLDYSPATKKGIMSAAIKSDIIHSHGLWNMTNIYSGIVAHKTKKPHIISPEGTLSQVALRKNFLLKKISLLSGQKKIINAADCLHATSILEYDMIRKAGYRNPIAIIPNGIDVPKDIYKRKNHINRRKRLLYLGRITPVKGIDTLLKAWSTIQNKYNEWDLYVTGIDDRGYEKQMKDMVRNINAKRVTFTGPVYAKDKTEAYLNADIFVLPSYTENFAIAVAEALSYGIPSIVTKAAPWSGIEKYKVGWWIETGVDSLVSCLEDALGCEQNLLNEMGDKGRKWMKQEFSWNNIGYKMLKTYQWILGNEDKPEWVNIN